MTNPSNKSYTALIHFNLSDGREFVFCVKASVVRHTRRLSWDRGYLLSDGRGGGRSAPNGQIICHVETKLWELSRNSKLQNCIYKI